MLIVVLLFYPCSLWHKMKTDICDEIAAVFIKICSAIISICNLTNTLNTKSVLMFYPF